MGSIVDIQRPVPDPEPHSASAESHAPLARHREPLTCMISSTDGANRAVLSAILVVDARNSRWFATKHGHFYSYHQHSVLLRLPVMFPPALTGVVTYAGLTH